MRRVVVAALMAVLTWSGHALAGDFPSHPITLVVPFSAGGPIRRDGPDSGRAHAEDARSTDN